ncbi:transcription initiation factor IIA large subunit-like isoform X1 [Olea europaea var. sylvestris]|uniref:Transcription initiation factor IIA large subunit-like n=2 Tax=Olea europaea subsp. europaea TaxID=158383 RepID=A0A8S0V635_OLEEU|nr:transcription initiation factor IIA large subunit-like isoform X1 [Olea europaea var. sylvestris]CAA3025402.1 transcription initiation factor IIA large subunit-like [Olea europaea subsp. europaea]
MPRGPLLINGCKPIYIPLFILLSVPPLLSHLFLPLLSRFRDMASSSTSHVYVHVIEDVISKVREEFVSNGGPGDSVLNELQGLWELKMMQAGAVLGSVDRSSMQKAASGGPITPNPVHDLNVPYEGTEEYETPTADLLFPPTPLQTPVPGMARTPLPGTAQTPLPGTADNNSYYNIHTGGTPITPNEYSSANDNGGVPEMRGGAGRPSPYMQPPSAWLNQRPPLDVNVAYVEGREDGERGGPHQPTTQEFFTLPSGKRKREDFPPGPPQYHSGGYIPQQDGAADVLSDDLKVVQGNNNRYETVNSTQQLFVQGGILSSGIPQFDGPIPDPYDDVLSTPNIYNYQEVANEDYNIVNTPAPNEIQAATPAPLPQSDTGDDDDDEPLNEDDDDELDDVDQGEDLNTTHLVLAQFDKVTRTKSRWKCTLKDGIMHINNKDILFNKATGEFEF